MSLIIDPHHTALLAMDFENDIVHEEGAFKEFGFAKMVKDNDVLGKTAELLTAARNVSLPVLYVSVKFRPGYPERPANAGLWEGLHATNALIEGTWGATIHSAVTPQEGEPVVTKRGVSAFMGSDLELILKNKRIGTVILVGVATNFVVEGTAREASDRGYRVLVVGDCCASVSREAHDAALSVAMPFLATVTTLEETLSALS